MPEILIGFALNAVCMRIPQFLIKICATFLGVGYIPYMPGTCASIAAVAVFIFIHGRVSVIFLSFLFLALGFLVSGPAEKIFRKKDASCIVIDEVAGMFLSLIWVPYDFVWVAVALILFRLFDIWKPAPIKWIQNLPGSAGVMSDDIMAAAYTTIAILFISRLKYFLSP